uniref:Uncharacterized protein n=1 Tax=Arion vulgaris TaxID=1028688 RepID=A0A0B7A8P3_9EUPU
MNQIPHVMDRQLDVLRSHTDGGLLLAASCMTGRYWLGSLWFYQTPEVAPNVDKCTAGVQLEAGICDVEWIDGTHVFVSLDTGRVAVWNLEDNYQTFTQLHSAAGHDGIVTSVSVVCDKTKAASSGHDKCIKLWDLSNTALVYTSQAHSDFVSCVDCHPSEPDIFVSCGQDDKILLWDRRKSKPASILNKSPLPCVATCVQWQPGGSSKIAYGSESGQIAILDTRMNTENYLTSTPHSRSVHSLQFCPSKPSLLASVSEDCRAVVTAVDDDGLRQIYDDNTHQDFAHGLTWFNESQFYTCGWDAKVLSHDLQHQSASFMGQSISGYTQIINENKDHKTEMGAGDIAQFTPAYSVGVNVQSEICAKG